MMKKYINIICACIILLFAGLIYAWSIFVAPLETEFGWQRAQTSFTFTLCMCFFCAGLLTAAFLLKRMKSQLIVIVAGIIIFAGFFLTSSISELWQLYIFYGVLCGFAVGIVYNTLLSVIPLWFPGKIGLINGVLLMVFSSGSLILSAVSAYLIGAYGWRYTFKLLGIAAIIIFFLLSFFQKKPVFSEKSGASEDGDISVTSSDMVKRRDFWFMFIWQTMVCAVGLSVIGHAASIAKDVLLPAALLPAAVGAVTVSSGLGRLLCGYLYEAIGVFKTMAIETAFGFLGSIILVLCVTTSSVILLFPGFVLMGLCYGSSPSMNATYVRKKYGNKYFSANFGIITLSLLPSSVIGIYITGVLRSASSQYTLALSMLILYMAIAFISAVFIKKTES